ncbi:hypothetical protein V8G54_033447 [Vigna mungo]|uniref:Uncharacterized protein n=1 Tax=Vigna mungo TaxID=3915 RepID=A0AAQ3MMY7_VIGMU
MLPGNEALTWAPMPAGEREVHGSKEEHLRVGHVVEAKGVIVLIRSSKSSVQLLQHPLPHPLLHLLVHAKKPQLSSHRTLLFLVGLPAAPVSPTQNPITGFRLRELPENSVVPTEI